MWTALCNFLISIINFIYNNIAHNYGVAIILFTIFIKLVLTPLDLKSRRSMRKQAVLGPQIEELKRKYGKDPEKLNQKQQELFKKEGVSMFGGCLPMLLTMPILFAMFSAMRSVANNELISQYLQMIHGQVPVIEPFLWIKNLWMPDSFAASIMPDANALKVITSMDLWNQVSQNLVNLGTLPQSALLSFTDKATFDAFIAAIPDTIKAAPLYATYLQAAPGWQEVNAFLFKFSVFVHMNGYFILPILAAGTQFVSQRLMQQPGAQTDSTASMNKSMMLMMPFMSLFFCMSYSSAFALYWVTSNVVATVQQIAFNRYFAWQDSKTTVAGEVGK